MNKLIPHSVFFVFTLLIAAAANSQQATTVKASVDKNRILIGEPITLTLEATIPVNEAIRFFYIDSLPHFEFLKRNKTDTTDKNSGTYLKQELQITSFDSGQWVLPPLVFSEGIQTDSIVIDVVFSDFDPNQPYHSIKDVIHVDAAKKKEDNLWWYVAGGAAVLLLLVLVYFLTRKKKKPAEVIKPPLTPYQEAIEGLKKIRTQKPAAKEYHSALSDIFRQYIWKREGIQSLQQTTDDLLERIKVLPLDKEGFARLSQSLLLGDFVKFARYEPTAQEDEYSFESVLEAIEELEKHAVERDRREAAAAEKK